MRHFTYSPVAFSYYQAFRHVRHVFSAQINLCYLTFHCCNSTVVGLTGGIATGKSTVSTLLKSYNIPVIDADVIARDVVLPGTPALAKIAKTFGQDVLRPDGYLDRPKLGSIVFSDESKRKQLNAIVHPAVRWKMFTEVLRYWWKGEKMCVLDIPLLVESALWKFVGVVVVVYW